MNIFGLVFLLHLTLLVSLSLYNINQDTLTPIEQNHQESYRSIASYNSKKINDDSKKQNERTISSDPNNNNSKSDDESSKPGFGKITSQDKMTPLQQFEGSKLPILNELSNYLKKPTRLESIELGLLQNLPTSLFIWILGSYFFINKKRLYKNNFSRLNFKFLKRTKYYNALKNEITTTYTLNLFFYYKKLKFVQTNSI